MKKTIPNVQCEEMGNTLTSKPPEDKVYRYELDSLKRRVEDLSKSITTLTVIVETLAKQSGVKIERYIGTTVISTI